ncbi:LysM domain-containing protein [Cognatiyoonia koreensis]|uniref:LysM domain-containing protein n=1 Tax=Cognatiyoonia koreensis TaxID=364200 RepID=A0A1I0NN07_9RHOB|nr:LysM peptidoglycan-binding domain-containing protein [Cognatiyoonia koreensis]SEW02837.1 LysM domain-containing protein [Cognatiyoonia koreensis]
MASQTRHLAMGALVAAAVGVAVVLLVQFAQTEDVPEIPVAVEAPETSETTNAPAEETNIALTEATTVAPAEETVTTSAPADEADVVRPAFDTFRVEGDGLFVIAGKAEAGQTVDIMLAGRSVERVVADASGSFGAVLMLEPSDQARRLALLADPEGTAVGSTETFLVQPFAASPVAIEEPTTPVVVGAVTSEVGAEIVASTDVAVPELPALGSVDIATPDANPATVLVTDAEGVRVVSNDRETPPEIAPNIALDTITYDPEGEVVIAGRASGNGFVQVYIDNQPVTSSRIEEGGNWRTDLPQIETGVYTLRVDEVDDAGTVVSRIETPFKREEAETVAAVLAEETAEEDFDVAVRTVQPGATLWAIAREELGQGILYVAVYEANKDLIRDPDLIYPGQVFRMPDAIETAD